MHRLLWAAAGRRIVGSGRWHAVYTPRGRLQFPKLLGVVSCDVLPRVGVDRLSPVSVVVVLPLAPAAALLAECAGT